ncbi:MAG: metal ABC transporter substrate-binding protein [Lentisphaeraceae bacterium]|nr:metal ABC transporter substrate-binding protein [Lentisphaeraceae bacterium]
MRLLLSILILLSLTACKEDLPDKAIKDVKISVTSYPLFWIAESLLDDKENIQYLIPKDVSPAEWQPSSQNIHNMLQSDRIFINGATFEKWLETTSIPRTKIVNSTKGLGAKFIVLKDAVQHKHDGDSHSHDIIIATTWLDSELMKGQIQNISKELQKLMPQKAKEIKKSENELLTKITQLHQKLKKALDSKTKLLSDSETFKYTARENGYDVQYIALKTLKDTDWQSISKAAAHSKTLIISNELALPVQEKLKKLGIKTIHFDQCSNNREIGDYIQVMENNIKALSQLKP